MGLAGDELSFADAARRLSGLAGREVEYEQLPPAQVEEAFGREWALMFRWFDEVGYDVDIPALRREWGLPVTGFEQWVGERPWAAPAEGAPLRGCGPPRA